MLEAEVKAAKQRLKAVMRQLDLNLQAAAPDLARQSTLQQKLDAAFNQAELADVMQGHKSKIAELLTIPALAI